MSKYLEIWVKSGCCYGVAMSVFYMAQQRNIASGALSGLLAGVLFGGATAALTVVSDKWLRKKGIEQHSASVNQTKSLKIFLPSSAVEPFVKTALLSLPKVTFKGFEDNTFHAKTGSTWKSFGEDISISLYSEDSHTVVHVSSQPKIKTTIADYGKNFENVHAICSHIKSALGEDVHDVT